MNIFLYRKYIWLYNEHTVRLGFLFFYLTRVERRFLWWMSVSCLYFTPRFCPGFQRAKNMS